MPSDIYLDIRIPALVSFILEEGAGCPKFGTLGRDENEITLVLVLSGTGVPVAVSIPVLSVSVL